MNDHSSLLILGGVVVALTPFALIGTGIARDYRAAHQKWPYEPHNGRNIVLGFAVAIVASVMFGLLSHPSPAPPLRPVRAESATGLPFVPLPTSVPAAAPRAASAGASAATSPRSTTTTSAVHGSGLVTAFVSTLVKGTTLITAPTVPPSTVVLTTPKPPTTTATTKSTVATTTTTRGATTTSTTLPRSTTTTVPATTTTSTTVPVTTTTGTTVPVTTTTGTTVPVTTTTGAP
jgi:hypothetical protein